MCPTVSIEASASAAPSSQELTIMLVDDSEDLRALLRYALPTKRCRIVAEAGDGVEALECVGGRPPDVIVLDLEMPNMDGWTALPLLRAKCPAAVIVIWSGAYPHPADTLVREAGADAFVEKGLPLATTRQRIFGVAGLN